ncbi:MAG TPA: PDDEXK nuclease domain-containing protein [Puia sp.]
MDKKYVDFITGLKQNIIQSRYIAARLINREILLLYFKTGKMLAEKIEQEEWGTGVVKQIADDYLMNMRKFYTEYQRIVFVQSPTAQFKLLSNATPTTLPALQSTLPEEFFIDLLFFNRHLQSLVAFGLKRGKFKPTYAGQLNFYLNVLDEKVRLPHENPSIGIILCKEKNNTIVEFAVKNIDKAMGVATYRTTKEPPKEMKDILPDPDALAKLL